MLEVIHLSKKYGKTLAADDVGFTVPDGRVGILLGPNGAGKSTVIKSIAGLLRYKGTARIQGLDSRTVEAKRCFAYVPELPYMYEALTIREHIEFITRAYGVTVPEEEIRGLFETFDLADKQDKLMAMAGAVASNKLGTAVLAYALMDRMLLLCMATLMVIATLNFYRMETA